MIRKKSFSILLLSFFLLLSFYGKSQQTVGVFLNDPLSYNGYTLFTIGKTTYLIDNCGFVINEWSSETTPGLSVYLLENGDLLRAGKLGSSLFGAGNGGVVEKYSWEGDLIWSFDYAEATYRQHHDIDPLPNGNVLLLGWEIILGSDAVTAGRRPIYTGQEVWSEFIVEVEPIGSDSGTIVWEWHAWDHLIQEFDEDKKNYGVVKDHPELFHVNYLVDTNPNTNQDWMHANGISYNATRDEIAISSRNFSEVWIIDHSTTTEEAAGHTGGDRQKGGDLLYRYGNPQTYNRGTIGTQIFFRQHNIRWIPDGHPQEGKMMVFNNGVNRPGGSSSSADIFTPPLLSDGSYADPGTAPYGPVDLDWTYEDLDYYSSILSSAQMMPNGNVLMCFGEKSHFREVTSSGEMVWDYQSPAGNTGPIVQGEMASGSIFRATRYSADFSGFEDKDLSPGPPIELDPIPLDCEIHENDVPIVDPEETGIRILQNPIVDRLIIKNNKEEMLHIEIIDINGRLQKRFSSAEQIINQSVTGWARGIYFFLIVGEDSNSQLLEKVIKQ